MKIVSWNVNGINAAIKKGAIDFILNINADIICLQEIKTSEKTIDKSILEIEGYEIAWNQAERKGYSGVMCLYREEPLSIIKGIGVKKFDIEGRVITLEYPDFYLINIYFVNAKRGLTRLDEKIEFNDAVLDFAENLKNKKSVILCGDFNVSHKEIDLKNPKSNKNNAGFSQPERDWFSKLLSAGYIDTFREFVKDGGHYTWWSYRNNARPRNIGWRLDYFVVSKEFMRQVKKSEILSDVMGSDHCPILLEVN